MLESCERIRGELLSVAQSRKTDLRLYSDPNAQTTIVYKRLVCRASLNTGIVVRTL